MSRTNYWFSHLREDQQPPLALLDVIDSWNVHFCTLPFTLHTAIVEDTLSLHYILVGPRATDYAIFLNPRRTSGG